MHDNSEAAGERDPAFLRHLEENVSARAVRLTDADMAAL